MIIIDLIYNLTLLVALSVVSSFIGQQWRHRWLDALLQGLVFGGAAVIGMLHPLVLSSGLIFDGRSVEISLCGLFFGPVAVGVAGSMAAICRIFQGGLGTLMGLLVILSSALIGLTFHARQIRENLEISASRLFGFGLLVHAAMILCMFTLPGDAAFSALKRIGPPVLLMYPLATVLIGKVLSDKRVQRGFLAELKKRHELFRTTLYSIGDAVISTDIQGRVRQMNPVAASLTGWSEEEALGRPVNEIFRIVNEETRAVVENPAECVLRKGRIVGLANHTLLIARDGTERPIADSGAPIQGELGEIIGVVLVFRDQSAERAAQEALRESEERFRMMVDAIPQMAAIAKPDGDIYWFNQRWYDYTGATPEQMAGGGWQSVHDPQVLPKVLEQWRISLATGQSFGMEFPLRGADGRFRHFLTRILPVRNSEGQIVRWVGTNTDITERKRAEEEREKLQAQLLQAQKMESVGRLAGGVAHDFNNMLGVIIGHTEMALAEVEPAAPLHDDLQEVHKAALRSADLTRQLLAFARKQTVSPKVLHLNQTVASMLKMLQRLIGEDIELAWKPGLELWPVKMDPSHVDQILANLAVNARDAIAGVGQLTLQTENVVFDGSCGRTHNGYAPGDYVLLAVSDTGSGMDKETLERIFEPFFTTKEVGKGTGLGLAMVYGAVKQNQGFIEVDSEPGQGTTFKIYLPRAEAAAKTTAVAAENSAHGTETVLLAEDEESILKLGSTILKTHGYTVLEARTPAEALAQAEGHEGPIHLLITDVVMPGMNGKELKARLTTLRPEIKVLFMSGYTSDVIAHQGVIDEDIAFLQKPFSVNTLTQKVRVVLQ